jgi:hypothetical protein
MTASNSPTAWIYSSKNNPCPICGRTKDGDCRISSDRLEVICHHPRDCRPGEVVRGLGDDRPWAFTKNTSDGRAAHFTIDKPRPVGPRRGSNVVQVQFPTQPRQPEQSAAPPAALPAVPQAPIELLQLPAPPADLVRINPAGLRKSIKGEDYILEAVYSYSETQAAWRLMPMERPQSATVKFCMGE